MKNFKIYGNEKTAITLSEHAAAAYYAIDPLELREYCRECPIEDENGEIIRVDRSYTYDLVGCICEEDMTAEEVTELLEEEYKNCHSFDLQIVYKNGETFEYYTDRTGGKYWVSNETDPDAVLQEMQDYDRETFEAIRQADNIEELRILNGFGTLQGRYDLDEIREEMPVSFEAGEGRNTAGGVNYMQTADGSAYAEIAAPAEASEDYGYLTLKAAIAAAYKGPKRLTFHYDGQEDRLNEDASAEGTIYTASDWD